MSNIKRQLEEKKETSGKESFYEDIIAQTNRAIKVAKYEAGVMDFLDQQIIKHLK